MRKILKRHLPDPESLFENRWLHWLKPVLGHPNLWHLNRESVARGVAIGLVTGLFLGPIQMLFGALIAVPLRANIPVTMFTTLYTNPFTMPPLYLLAYGIGGLVTGERGQAKPLPEFEWTWRSVSNIIPDLLAWVGSMGTTLLIGLGIMASCFAVIGYLGVKLAWRWHVTHEWRKRAEKRRAAHGID